MIVLEDFVPQLGALNVRQETEVLQLWHACGAFKLFGLSELGLTDLAQNTRNHRTYTRAIVSGSAMAPFYSEAFGMNINNIRQTGIPRTDVFLMRIIAKKRLRLFMSVIRSGKTKKSCSLHRLFVEVVIKRRFIRWNDFQSIS